jgi:hypothetical protein
LPSTGFWSMRTAPVATMRSTSPNFAPMSPLAPDFFLLVGLSDVVASEVVGSLSSAEGSGSLSFFSSGGFF